MYDEEIISYYEELLHSIPRSSENIPESSGSEEITKPVCEYFLENQQESYTVQENSFTWDEDELELSEDMADLFGDFGLVLGVVPPESLTAFLLNLEESIETSGILLKNATTSLKTKPHIPSGLSRRQWSSCLDLVLGVARANKPTRFEQVARKVLKRQITWKDDVFEEVMNDVMGKNENDEDESYGMSCEKRQQVKSILKKSKRQMERAKTVSNFDVLMGEFLYYSSSVEGETEDMQKENKNGKELVYDDENTRQMEMVDTEDFSMKEFNIAKHDKTTPKKLCAWKEVSEERQSKDVDEEEQTKNKCNIDESQSPKDDAESEPANIKTCEDENTDNLSISPIFERKETTNGDDSFTTIDESLELSHKIFLKQDTSSSLVAPPHFKVDFKTN